MMFVKKNSKVFESYRRIERPAYLQCAIVVYEYSSINKILMLFSLLDENFFSGGWEGRGWGTPTTTANLVKIYIIPIFFFKLRIEDSFVQLGTYSMKLFKNAIEKKILVGKYQKMMKF